MRILVTGGAGYIGSIAAETLVEEGFEVSVLDDLSSGIISKIPKEARFIQGSLLEKQKVLDALEGCDAVLHFAGKSLVGESVTNPELYQEINVEGSRTLFSQMRLKEIRKLVFSSSAATYGNSEKSPISERAETSPTNPYGATKLQIEGLIDYEAKNYGLCAISLRYFNVAGAKRTKTGWLFEEHDPETHLIPNVLTSSKTNPVKIFGTDWPTWDGTCIRDYVHVVDLIGAHLKALNFLVKPGHEIFNIGSGSGYSVRDVLGAAIKVTGISIPSENAQRRMGDPAVLVADVSKARDVLNWTPQKSLTEMVADTWLAQNTHS